MLLIVYLDPVIIMAISYLVAKRKSYSGQINIDEIINYSIYQQEMINLLSFYYNYSFTVDLPINFIQYRYKRGLLKFKFYLHKDKLINYYILNIL